MVVVAAAAMLAKKNCSRNGRSKNERQVSFIFSIDRHSCSPKTMGTQAQNPPKRKAEKHTRAKQSMNESVRQRGMVLKALSPKTSVSAGAWTPRELDAALKMSRLPFDVNTPRVWLPSCASLVEHVLRCFMMQRSAEYPLARLIDTVAVLLNHGANLNARRGQNYAPVLHLCVCTVFVRIAGGGSDSDTGARIIEQLIGLCRRQQHHRALEWTTVLFGLIEKLELDKVFKGPTTTTTTRPLRGFYEAMLAHGLDPCIENDEGKTALAVLHDKARAAEQLELQQQRDRNRRRNKQQGFARAVHIPPYRDHLLHLETVLIYHRQLLMAEIVAIIPVRDIAFVITESLLPTRHCLLEQHK
jgi:hypothetical protein